MSLADLGRDALARLDTHGWLAGSRRAGLERFLAEGLPGPDREEWRYTPLDHLERAPLHAPGADSGGRPCPDLSRYPGHVLAFLNGHLVCHGTYLVSQLAGSLQALADSQVVQAHFGRLAGDATLARLNQALWQDGARLYVPAGERVGLPIFVVHAADEAEAMLHPRTLAVLEADSEAVLVEHYAGRTDAAYWQNAVTEIILGAGARLTHVRLCEEGVAATHTGLTAVELAEDSEYRCLHVGLSGLICRHDLAVGLAGAGAGLRVDALDLAAAERRHADLHLRVDHLAPRTRSRVAYRALADRHGRAVFDGRVVVGRAAHGTDAGQSCRGLLLSPHAEVDARPQLEIYADDVQCSHGVAVGQLDTDALFYLRSRGIDAAAARRMLLQAFAEDALGLLDETKLRAWLMPGLLTALAGPAEEGGR